jgi:proteasome lid subunit RPN8/RPN11
VTATPGELAGIRRHAEAEYPSECCGVILARGDGDRILMRCRNIQDALHRSNPVEHPRDSRTAYYIDPKDLLAVGRREAEGYEVTVIYHSHCEARAYFSETDTRNALFDGEPAYPHATYVVVSVVGGRVTAGAAFGWSPERREFMPVAFPEFAA